MQERSRNPADSLANPVRTAMVERLRVHGAATLDELAAAAEVHRNTARAHADALANAGVIERVRESEHAGVGRPPTRYRLTTAGQAADPPPLANLLGAALDESKLSQREARRVARLRAAAAKRLLPRRRGLRELETELAELGFSARVSDEQVELEHCPCPVVSPDNPAIVCALVSGTVDGTLERIGSDDRVVGASHDPARRRCTLRLGAD